MFGFSPIDMNLDPESASLYGAPPPVTSADFGGPASQYAPGSVGPAMPSLLDTIRSKLAQFDPTYASPVDPNNKLGPNGIPQGNAMTNALTKLAAGNDSSKKTAAQTAADNEASIFDRLKMPQFQGVGNVAPAAVARRRPA